MQDFFFRGIQLHAACIVRHKFMGVLNLVFNVDCHIFHSFVVKVICPMHPGAIVGHIPDSDSETIMANSYRLSVLVKADHITKSSANIVAKMADGFLGNVIGIGKIAINGMGSKYILAQLPIQLV